MLNAMAEKTRYIIVATRDTLTYYYQFINGTPSVEFMAGSGRNSKASRKLATPFSTESEANVVAERLRNTGQWTITVELL